jgi:anti-anti-sigma factor
VPDPIVITPQGDIDVATVPEFRDALAEAASEAADGLVVDLSEVAFIDSSGLRVILEVNEQLRRERRELAVVAPRGTAAAVVLTLAGLRRTLAVFDSRGAALRR